MGASCCIAGGSTPPGKEENSTERNSASRERPAPATHSEAVLLHVQPSSEPPPETIIRVEHPSSSAPSQLSASGTAHREGSPLPQWRAMPANPLKPSRKGGTSSTSHDSKNTAESSAGLTATARGSVSSGSGGSGSNSDPNQGSSRTVTSDGGGSSIRSDDVSPHLRRFFSDGGQSAMSMNSASTTTTQVYVPGEVANLNMIPINSAVAEYTLSDSTIPSTMTPSETDGGQSPPQLKSETDTAFSVNVPSEQDLPSENHLVEGQ